MKHPGAFGAQIGMKIPKGYFQANRILLSLILLSCITILSIVSASYGYAQGYVSFSPFSYYPAQYGYPSGGQGFISGYPGWNNYATAQAWSIPQYFSQSPVYSAWGSSSYAPSLPSFLFSSAFPSAYDLNGINYGSTFQGNQTSVQSSIPASMPARTSLNTTSYKTLPFTDLFFPNYYSQGLGSLYQTNLFNITNAYPGNLGSSLYSYNTFPAVTYASFPAFTTFPPINLYTGSNTFSLTSPYQSRNNSYKGQIHCHTTNSDGADSPGDLVTAYKNAGYDFIVVTDHDTVTPSPSVPGIRFIQGCEETALTGHIGRLACSTQTPVLDAQTILNIIRADGGISILNHPWGSDDYENDWTIQEIERLNRYDAIEIFNGSQQAREHNAELHWDSALSRGVFVWGVATDDCHSIEGSGFNQGWIVVHADSDSEANIIKGIRSGNFYSSSGPDLTLSTSASKITARTETSSTIEFIGNNGALLHTTSATTAASYTVKGSERYIRVKVTRDTDRRSAWSNPVVINR